MRELIISLVLLLWVQSVSAQPEAQWTGRYGGEEQDWVYTVLQTADNGFAMAGLTFSFGNGQSDCYLLKIDDEGQEQWSRTYGGAEEEYCRSLVLLQDGFSLAGFTQSFGAGSRDFYLVRTDEQGEELWSRTFGGAEWDYCESHISTMDGGFILVGHTSSFNEGQSGIYIVKTDGNGNEAWSTVLYHEESFSANTIVQDWDGNYSISGIINYRDNNPERDIFLLKMDSAGNELWYEIYGTEAQEVCYDHVALKEGGYALGSSTRYYDENDTLDNWDQDFYLVRIDSAGAELWSQIYEYYLDESCFSLIRTNDDGFALAGITRLSANEADVYFLKTGSEPQGAAQWGNTLMPCKGELTASYPNPFNAVTAITYSVSRPSQVSMMIYNTHGQLVDVLVDRVMQGGGTLCFGMEMVSVQGCILFG